MHLSFKENQEKLNLEIFRSLYENFPEGRIRKSESPDFIIEKNQKKKTGIELSGIPAVEDFDSLIREVKHCLKKKNEKLKLYKKKGLDEYWLIISCELPKLPDSFRVKEKLYFHLSPHGFNKVFLLDMFQNKVYDLSDK
jgi:hypothetical protein